MKEDSGADSNGRITVVPDTGYFSFFIYPSSLDEERKGYHPHRTAKRSMDRFSNYPVDILRTEHTRNEILKPGLDSLEIPLYDEEELMDRTVDVVLYEKGIWNRTTRERAKERGRKVLELPVIGGFDSENLKQVTEELRRNFNIGMLDMPDWEFNNFRFAEKGPSPERGDIKIIAQIALYIEKKREEGEKPYVIAISGDRHWLTSSYRKMIRDDYGIETISILDLERNSLEDILYRPQKILDYSPPCPKLNIKQKPKF